MRKYVCLFIYFFNIVDVAQQVQAKHYEDIELAKVTALANMKTKSPVIDVPSEFLYTLFRNYNVAYKN